MNSEERFHRMLTEASVILDGLGGLLEGRRWNLAVRRSQEAVELVLKALLTLMAVEYPKAHDVGGVLVRTLQRQRPDILADRLNWIEAVSKRLARARAPAFYHEEEFSEEEAREAVQDAQQVMTFGREIVEWLRGQGR